MLSAFIRKLQAFLESTSWSESIAEMKQICEENTQDSRQSSVES